MTKTRQPDDTVIIKKYANRRLYDMSTSSYVSLDHLAGLVRREVNIEVRDAKTGEDLTRSVLTQIIFEKENKGDGALPLSFLRQLIGFYGGGAQTMLPAWLDMSMNSFAEGQERWRKAMGSAHPMTFFEKQTRRNMEMFEQAMRMFSAPGGAAMGAGFSRPEPEAGEEKPSASDAKKDDAMAALKAQMQMMQQQLDNLSNNKS